MIIAYNKAGPPQHRKVTMMWLLQLWLAAALTPRAINLAFAALCLAAALGANARLVMVLSALLYLAQTLF